MENKNILIGAGVVVVGYLLWKKSQNDELNKRVQNMTKTSDMGMPQVGISKVITEGVVKPKIFIGDSINPNNQNAPRIVNDIAIDKLPNIINQEDIQLFLFNNSNISSIEDNTIRDAKGYPIYTKLRKSDVKKDIFGNIVSGNANEGNFYKENGKYYLNTPTSAGSQICEISEKDYFDFFVNIKEGSYKKIISPTIQKNNCSFKFGSQVIGVYKF